nr:hypothetical protein [Tanacetum cinerariifolium]
PLLHPRPAQLRGCARRGGPPAAPHLGPACRLLGRALHPQRGHLPAGRLFGAGGGGLWPAAAHRGRARLGGRSHLAARARAGGAHGCPPAHHPRHGQGGAATHRKTFGWLSETGCWHGPFGSLIAALPGWLLTAKLLLYPVLIRVFMRMNESFEDPKAAQNTVRRYERMVAHDEAAFFDLEEFEIIIDYYVTSAAFDKAQQACEVALNQYPFSTELLIDRAQISAMRGDYTEAERQIANVASLDPDNADVAVTRGIIATQRGEFNEAVRFFQAALA